MLQENDLDLDEFDELRDEFRVNERRRLTLRRNSTRGWRNVPSRLFSRNAGGQQPPSSNSKRRLTKRESSLVPGVGKSINYLASARTSVTGSYSSGGGGGGGGCIEPAIAYESVMREIWERETNELYEMFVQSLREFVNEDSLFKSMREEMGKFESFEKMLRY